MQPANSVKVNLGYVWTISLVDATGRTVVTFKRLVPQAHGKAQTLRNL